MQRLAALILVVAIVVGGYIGYTRGWFTSIVPQPAAPAAITVATSTLEKQTADYQLDVSYPSFGVPAMDTQVASTVQAIADELVQEAKTDKPAAAGFRPYVLTGDFDRVYVGADYVSARLIVARDTGGAHPLPIIIGLDFDRKTGASIGPEKALDLIGMDIQQLASAAKSQLSAKLGKDVIFPQGANPMLENYQTFILDDKNVTFIFQPYQVAPYAAGAPEVTFPRVK